MIILLLILAVCTLAGVKGNRFHDDYCGREQSAAIKGILAVIILFSHMRGYLTLTSAVDVAFDRVLAMIGQLMVTMFFFYSGFGIAEAWRGKPNYSKGFFKKRILRILIHFNLAVLLFAVLNLVLGISYTAKEYLLCWTGWTSIGNSNWYVFDTLAMYLIALVAMRLCEKAKLGVVTLSVITSILCVALWWVLYRVRGAEQSWWYDTILCFPAGLCYAAVKQYVDPLARKPILWWLGLIGLGAVFAFLYTRNMLAAYSVCTAVFCVLVVWITMKVKVCNRLLAWLGANAFAIYILQRIPMILLAYFGLNQNPYLFAALTMAAIFPMSAGFTKLLSKVDDGIFMKRQTFPGKVK